MATDAELETPVGPTDAAPELSVIIPCWNAAESILRAIDSVLEAGDVALECIVVDDGSTDGTLAIVEAIAGRDPRVKVLRSPTNVGASAARNRGLEVARGTWISFLDADDRFLPGGLDALVRPIRRSDPLAVVGQRIKTDGERTWIPKVYDRPDIRDPGRKSVATHPGLLYYAGAPGKLFHRSCTTDLWFEGRVLGDQPWTLRALLRAGDRIDVIGDVVYEWRRPHPDHYVPTITTERQRSAGLAADAVEMAGPAFRIVTAEIDRLVEQPRREALAASYFDRLLLADLTDQLSAALRRSDPEIGLVFHAFGRFFETVPDVILNTSEPLVDRILRPPLVHWRDIAHDGRSAYWTMLRVVLDADGPSIVRRLHRGRLVSPALRLTARRDNAATRFLSGLILDASCAVVNTQSRIRQRRAA